jgi:hypothetical protein
VRIKAAATAAALKIERHTGSSAVSALAIARALLSWNITCGFDERITMAVSKS